MILLFVHIQHLVFMVIIAVMNKKILLALISAKEHVHFLPQCGSIYYWNIF